MIPKQIAIVILDTSAVIPKRHNISRGVDSS